MKSAVIIGCGYLGMKIATLLSQKKIHVTATTRHVERLKELAQVAQKGVILKSTQEEVFHSLIQVNDLIIVTIAPDRREAYDSTYLQTAQTIRQIAASHPSPKWLIYTSSTSVYGDHHGLWVDEDSPLLSQTPQGKCLIDTENCYLSLKEFGWTTTLFRVSELYGPPGRELQQKALRMQEFAAFNSKDHYTNMIHGNDAATAIDYAISHHLKGIYNLADDEHPTRQEFYSQLAKHYQLAEPTWDPSLSSFHSDNKRVSNHKIKSAGFSFEHPHRNLAM